MIVIVGGYTCFRAMDAMIILEQVEDAIAYIRILFLMATSTGVYIVRGGFTPESGYEAMERLLNTDPLLSAVFVSNDLMAVGAIKACTQNGIRIPEDISIIGFDDIDFSRYLIPSLTTVKKSRKSMGREGALMLLDIFSGRDSACKIKEIETELIIRELCAKFAGV